MFKSIRFFCKYVLFSDTAQATWTDIVRERRTQDTTLPVNFEQWTWVPKHTVWTFMDESYAKKRLEADPERIESQRASLAENGWQEPILVTWDQNGKAKVKDGNHRLIAAMSLDHEYVPIELFEVPGIRNGATRLADVFDGIMRDYGEQTRYRMETQDYLL